MVRRWCYGFDAFWSAGAGRHLFDCSAIWHSLASWRPFLRIEQHALGGNVDPDQAIALVFEALGAGGGANAAQAVHSLLPAQRDVIAVLVVLVDRDLVAEFAVSRSSFFRPYPVPTDVATAGLRPAASSLGVFFARIGLASALFFLGVFSWVFLAGSAPAAEARAEAVPIPKRE